MELAILILRGKAGNSSADSSVASSASLIPPGSCWSSEATSGGAQRVNSRILALEPTSGARGSFRSDSHGPYQKCCAKRQLPIGIGHSRSTHAPSTTLANLVNALVWGAFYITLLRKMSAPCMFEMRCPIAVLLASAKLWSLLMPHTQEAYDIYRIPSHCVG